MEATKETSNGLKQFISFRVGAEDYGLELLRVKEVIRVREITWLPKAPSFVKGIINLRGDVIPIIDLRDRFGLVSHEQTEMTRVIVAEVDGRLIGMVDDSASQVVRIPSDQIDPPPVVLDGFSHEFISGVGRIDDQLIVILDAEAILTVDEKSELSAVGSPFVEENR